MAALPLPPQRRYQGKVVLVTGASVVCLYACIRVTACVSTRLNRSPPSAPARTGGAAGIGAAICRRFFQEGAKVCPVRVIAFPCLSITARLID